MPRTSRRRRSRSTNGRSGSATRRRRRSTRRGSTATRCPTSSAPAGPSSRTRSWPASSRSRRSPSSSSSANRGAMSTSICEPRRAPSSRTGPPARSTPAGCSGSARISATSPPAEIPQSYLPENHWLEKLRDNKSALYLKYESHFDRFLAYDTELTLPIPVRIRGGPDEYTLQNLTDRRLLDVAVIAPSDQGFRVGWLDELPAAAAEKKDKKGKGASPLPRSLSIPSSKPPSRRRRPTSSSATPSRRRRRRKSPRRCRPRAMRRFVPGSTSSSTSRSP